MHSSTEVFGEPEKWEFDFPFEELKTAFWLWSMSDFKHLPNIDDIRGYSKEYISDMKLMHQLYSHQGNTTPQQLMVDELVAKEKAALKMTPEEIKKTKKPRWNVSHQKPIPNDEVKENK